MVIGCGKDMAADEIASYYKSQGISYFNTNNFSGYICGSEHGVFILLCDECKKKIGLRW